MVSLGEIHHVDLVILVTEGVPTPQFDPILELEGTFLSHCAMTISRIQWLWYVSVTMPGWGLVGQVPVTQGGSRCEHELSAVYFMDFPINSAMNQLNMSPVLRVTVDVLHIVTHLCMNCRQWWQYLELFDPRDNLYKWQSLANLQNSPNYMGRTQSVPDLSDSIQQDSRHNVLQPISFLLGNLK